MRKSIPVVTLIAASLVLGGCASNTGTGAAIGAATGAVLGKSTGNHKDKRIFIGAQLVHWLAQPSANTWTNRKRHSVKNWQAPVFR